MTTFAACIASCWSPGLAHNKTDALGCPDCTEHANFAREQIDSAKVMCLWICVIFAMVWCATLQLLRTCSYPALDRCCGELGRFYNELTARPLNTLARLLACTLGCIGVLLAVTTALQICDTLLNWGWFSQGKLAKGIISIGKEVLDIAHHSAKAELYGSILGAGTLSIGWQLVSSACRKRSRVEENSITSGPVAEESSTTETGSGASLPFTPSKRGTISDLHKIRPTTVLGDVRRLATASELGFTKESLARFSSELSDGDGAEGVPTNRS
jgi:hypothetical protein